MRKLLLLLMTTAALALPFAAQASATTDKVPFDADVLACNGDVIHISGTPLSIFTETTTPSGGFVVSSHFQPQGIKGVDLPTGTPYVPTGLTRDILVVIVSEVFHTTVSPNGDVISFVDNFSSTC
jgi:hypothetical protein